MKTISIIATITLAGASAAMLDAAEEVRSFDNGFAQRGAGNVYAVFNFTGAGARDQDKDIDGGDGPLKGGHNRADRDRESS